MSKEESIGTLKDDIRAMSEYFTQDRYACSTRGSIPYIVRECSRCGYEYSMTSNFMYCPMCGIRMKITED